MCIEICKMDYSVVLFEDNSVAAVPSNWFNKKKEKCAWPKTKNLNHVSKFIEKKCSPAKFDCQYIKGKEIYKNISK